MLRAESLVDAVLAAGREIMAIYASGDAGASAKADGSPVTLADRRGEAVIVSHLRRDHPGIPVVAEEAASEGHVPEVADTFFLVDPLDGTKEFVSRNGEFTVNIGFVRAGVPVCGVVYAPALGDLYGGDEDGAWTMRVGDPRDPRPGERRPISVRRAPDRLVAVGSRSHGSAEGSAFLDRFAIERFEPRGSSLKFCTIAAGRADIYPRFGRTMEWDTAAADAVLRAAGGTVTTPDGSPFRYGKCDQADDVDFANPFFVAYGDPSLCAAS